MKATRSVATALLTLSLGCLAQQQRAPDPRQSGAQLGLPALTATQQVDEALWLYAGFLSFGHYYLPNSDYTGWVITTASQAGVDYVQNVRSHAGANCL